MLTEIIDDLYIGTSADVATGRVLLKLNVCTLITLEQQPPHPLSHLGKLNQFIMPFKDIIASQGWAQDAARWLSNGLQIGPVIVHCGDGNRYSPTIVALFLVRNGMPVDDAISLIKDKRPEIDDSFVYKTLIEHPEWVK